MLPFDINIASPKRILSYSKTSLHHLFNQCHHDNTTVKAIHLLYSYPQLEKGLYMLSISDTHAVSLPKPSL